MTIEYQVRLYEKISTQPEKTVMTKTINLFEYELDHLRKLSTKHLKLVFCSLFDEDVTGCEVRIYRLYDRGIGEIPFNGGYAEWKY